MKYHGDSNPYNVDSVWEARLRPEIISNIQSAAKQYGKSMSWVVRYCVFMLYRNGKDATTLQEMAEALREKNQSNPVPASELHRLRICLYGDDERILLELKYRYRLTVTMVIRLALQIYLGGLSAGTVSAWEFFWFGLKFFAGTKVIYSKKHQFPQVDFHFKTFLSQKDYWGFPPGAMPTFLCA